MTAAKFDGKRRKHKSSNRRRVAFRFFAVLLAVAPFAAVELLLRACNYPPVSASAQADPFVDLGRLHPLFVPAENGQLTIPEERLDLFRPVSFTRQKPPGTLRVFALGGSTTQGEPFSTETAFPCWMNLCLTQATGREIEVINCGGLSYASYRVKVILEEVLAYDPDLIVIYTGHNEYLEHRTLSPSRARLLSNLARKGQALKLVQLVRGFLDRPTERDQPKPQTTMQREVDALLDYQGGLEDYQREAEWMSPIGDQFAWNLRAMATLCSQQDVPLVLAAPASNLLDCPPIKFAPAPKLSLDDAQAFEQHWQAARAAAAPEQAIQQCQLALEIDPEHAGVHYLLGLLLVAAGQIDQGKGSLVAARDYDVCPLRAPTPLYNTVLDVSQEFGVPCLDTAALLEQQSAPPITGKRWLVDHVHPSIEGHQLIARELTKLITTSLPKTFEVVDLEWEDHLDTSFSAHLGTLGEAYFQRGKQRLAGLELWTQGRAKKVRP